MGKLVILFFCMVNNGFAFSETSIMSPINPNDDELHHMMVKGEIEEIIRIVPTAVPHSTANDVQGSSIASSIALSESEANIATESPLINAIDSNGASKSLTQPLIYPKIDALVANDEITKSISTTINSTTVNDQGSSYVSSITPLNDIQSDTSTVSTTTMNVTLYYPENGSGSLARLLIAEKVEVKIRDEIISSTSTTLDNEPIQKITLQPTTVNPVTTDTTDSVVNKPTTDTPSSPKGIQKIKTWFSKVGQFFSDLMSHIRNIFRRKH